MPVKNVKMSEVSVGDQVPEEDGFLFDVIEVNEVAGGEIELMLASDFSTNKNHWECNGGVALKQAEGSLIVIVDREAA